MSFWYVNSSNGNNPIHVLIVKNLWELRQVCDDWRVTMENRQMIVNHKSWQREMVLVLFGSGSEQEFVSKICTQMASDWRRLSGILCLPGCIQVRVVPHLPGEGL